MVSFKSIKTFFSLNSVLCLISSLEYIIYINVNDLFTVGGFMTINCFITIRNIAILNIIEYSIKDKAKITPRNIKSKDVKNLYLKIIENSLVEAGMMCILQKYIILEDQSSYI